MPRHWQEPFVRIGIVTHWFNRGQGTVGRHLRSIFDAPGITPGTGASTFVLARPTRSHFVRPSFVDDTDVWNQPDVAKASRYEIPAREYLDWARGNALD